MSREQAIAGLRALASFLIANPGVPIGYVEMTYHVCPGSESDDEQGLRELERLAKVLKVEVTSDDDTHFYARRTFGSVTYKAAYIRAAEMRDWQELMEIGRERKASRAARGADDG